MSHHKVLLTDPYAHLEGRKAGIVGQLWSSFFERFIAQVHKCMPPADGSNWFPISVHLAERTESGVYKCPECGCHFASRRTGC